MKYHEHIFGMTMGFTQSLRERTRLEVLYARVCEEFGSTCNVHFPRESDSNAKAAAAFVSRNLAADGILDWANYSFGGGMWFPTFEAGLHKRGRHVRRLYLVDPVRWLPLGRAARWLSALRTPVRLAKGGILFLQTKNYPRSGGVRWDGDYETINFGEAVGHAQIDNYERVHHAIVSDLNRAGD